MLKEKRFDCDLCVVGGGMAGLCAAIAAAREGLSVVLMHERPVLGGNASSEIRMWVCGADGENNRETGILEEIMLENIYRNPTKSYALWDTVLYDFARREKTLTLLLNCTCMKAETESGDFAHGRSVRIKSVTGYQMTTQSFCTVYAKNYCDSSGDSILAPLCGAAFRVGREAAEEFGENTAVKTADSLTMGSSCLVYGVETDKKVDFIPPEFAKKITHEDVRNRFVGLDNDTENFWYLELGGNANTIDDAEDIRDELIPLAMGMWDYVKNVKGGAECWDVDFLGFLPGKRESRRMMGQYVITANDIYSGKAFEDEIAFGGWPVDDHFPGGFYHKGIPNTSDPTPAPYSIPYRALYSKNVENLFFAGRNISMTHMAMSSVRVMATCALLGEAVGKAAAVATKEKLTPHGVYLEKLDVLQTLLLEEDCFLPSKLRGRSESCLRATLVGAGDEIRNGQDRAHRIYNTTEDIAGKNVRLGDSITYQIDGSNVKKVHLVFDSDLNRRTLTGSQCERTHGTRSNRKLEAPRLTMPKTLCRAFKVIGIYKGEEMEFLRVENNRRRCYHLEINRCLDQLVLIPTETWGDNASVKVISFDFQ